MFQRAVSSNRGYDKQMDNLLLIVGSIYQTSTVSSVFWMRYLVKQNWTFLGNVRPKLLEKWTIIWKGR